MTAIFSEEGPGDVPLSNAPLDRTLAQIRFPIFSAFKADDDRVAGQFAVTLSDDYPLFHEGHEVNITITADGITQSPGTARLWKLGDATGTWQVSFGHGFLSVETSSYGTREDFIERLTNAWSAFINIAKPPFIERIGVRYVNRLSDPSHLEELPRLVRSEVLGVVGGDAGNGELVRSLSESLYQLPDNVALLARWGFLPPGGSIDPTLPSASVPSWILDLDAFQTWTPGTLVRPDVNDVSSSLALRAYQFFRWAVTPQFLRLFGGDIQ